MAQFNFKAIGTTWRIDINQEIDISLEHSLLEKIRSRIDKFDQAYSRFRNDSTVTQISRKAGIYEFPADSVTLFNVYHDLYKKTDGYFTPLVGQMLVDAGYDPQYSLKQKKELEAPPKWEDVMDFKIPKHFKDNDQVKPTLTVKNPVQLDFGAGGKGYIIDLVGEVIENNGINSYCINAGGDILYKGLQPIRTGLEDPTDTRKVIGVCNLQNMSIAGSAGNRRRWGNFTHIINPKTRNSSTNIAAVWVVAKSAFIADSLTTCIYFVDPTSLLLTYKFEYLILYNDYSINKSANFPAEMFTS